MSNEQSVKSRLQADLTASMKARDEIATSTIRMLRAAITNVRAGRLVQGGSTISQQLAKNLFLGPERTLTRKFAELVLAPWLETRLGKRCEWHAHR